MSDRIELHPAFVWDCEDCGRENFVRAISDLGEDIKAEIEEIWCLAPESVTCNYCGSVFYAVNDDEEGY